MKGFTGQKNETKILPLCFFFGHIFNWTLHAKTLLVFASYKWGGKLYYRALSAFSFVTFRTQHSSVMLKLE
jgi:hypothetical protein